IHTQYGTDLRPDFLREIVVDVAIAGRAGVRLLVLAATSRGKNRQRAENENQQTRLERHFESLASALSSSTSSLKSAIAHAHRSYQMPIILGGGFQEVLAVF